MGKPPNEVRNPQPPEEPEPSSGLTGTIAHMEEEFKELEQLNRPRWAMAIAALLLIGGAVGGYFYFVRDRGASLAPPVPIEGVLMDVSQPPNGSVLDAPPPIFAWESVTSRHDYLFTLKLEKAPTALLERSSRSSTLRLTQDDSKLVGSGSYVWIVRARAKDGTVLGTGHGRFRIR